MRNLLRSIMLFAVLLLPGLAHAQCSIPSPLPVNTVLGRLGVTPGPCQAIPFATLFSNLGGTSQLSLLGRALNSVGPLAPISAVAGSSCAFIESSSTIICGQLATAGLANNAVTFAKMQTIAADNIAGNPTGSTAAMQPVPVVNCQNALNYSTSSHAFSCNSNVQVTVGALAPAFGALQ